MDLYTALDPALSVRFSDLERSAIDTDHAPISSVGSIVQRSNKGGFPFLSYQYYDATGKKKERYIAGPIGSEKANTARAALEAQLAEQRQIVAAVRMLGREGFAMADTKAYATLAGLHNHGIFRAGALLVGSHAFGVLLNRLGVRAAPYATEDQDIARNETLAFSRKPTVGFKEMLQESGKELLEVPSFDRKMPATSFKQKGHYAFRVDLLVPGRGEEISVVRVPELDAYAQALPFLKYLLAESQMSALLSRIGAVAVRVPMPERLAVHKLIVAALRSGRSEKVQKDLWQASVLCAALADRFPGAITDALGGVPPRAKKYFRKMLPQMEKRLLPRYERAWNELNGR